MKKILSFSLALLLTTSLGISVKGEPISNSNKEEAENQLKQSQIALTSAEDKLFQLEVSIQKLDIKIEALLVELEDNKKAILKSEGEINIAKDNVNVAEMDIKAQQELFDNRMRVLYKNGSQGYLSIILKSENFSDLVTRVNAVNRIINFDNNIADALAIKKEDLIEKQKILEIENSKLIALKVEKETKLQQQKANKDEQLKLIADAKKQRSLLADKVKKDKATINAAVKAMDDQAISMATSASSSDADIETAISYLTKRNKEINSTTIKQAITKGNQIINSRKVIVSDRGAGTGDVSGISIALYAQKFLGSPYLWGGTRPYVLGDRDSGFDCSGLVQYCYRQFGISITRTTYTQVKYDGKVVSKDELKPGDLIFFGSWDDVHHVGMYIGNGCFIHAPQTGDFVKISPLSERPDYLVARRIIN